MKIDKQMLGNKLTNKQNKRGDFDRIKAYAFKKGQSGNPKGRPKDMLTTLLRSEVVKKCPQDKQNRTWLQLVVLATIQLAIKGHPTALKEIWERIDGKVIQQIESPSEIKVKIVYDRL